MPAPRRVAQVSFFIDPLGRPPERVLEAWSGLTVPAEAAAAAGWEVTVVQASHQEGEIRRGGVAYRFVAERGAFSPRRTLARLAAPATPRVEAVVASLEPSVVHVHGLSYPRHVARLARRLPGAALLVQDHADRPPRPWRRAGYRARIESVAGVLFTAREQADPFFEAGAFPPGLPVHEVIESTTRFTPGSQADARSRTGAEGDPLLLWVGRLDENKDPLTVLAAFARTAGELPAGRLRMCYTDAPILSRVRERIRSDAALAGRVELLGRRSPEDVQELLRAADFLVLGSHREGSGYAVIEALACGTTPLVTDIPSFRRITGNGAVGALSPTGDVDAMARAIVAWAKKPHAELRAAARAHFERHLSVAAIRVELDAAYRAALEAVAAAPDAPTPTP